MMFRYAYFIKCTSFKKDATGRITEVEAVADLEPAGKKPPKGILNWVAQPQPGQDPPTAEVSVSFFLCCISPCSQNLNALPLIGSYL
jgi:hypothetical protein